MVASKQRLDSWIRKDSPEPGRHYSAEKFLTGAGDYADPFTLQDVAGHGNIMARGLAAAGAHESTKSL